MCSLIDTNQQAFHLTINVKIKQEFLKFTDNLIQCVCKGYNLLRVGHSLYFLLLQELAKIGFVHKAHVKCLYFFVFMYSWLKK